MVTKENGLKYAKLIHVSVDNGKTENSNKVYIMEEQADGRIKCQYGRVGEALKTEFKDGSKWVSVYKQKTGRSKNYTDVTDLLTEPVVSANPDKKVGLIEDNIVRKLVEELMAYANKSIQTNYKVTQESVSEQQVESAQEVINQLSSLVKVGVDIKHINNMLIKLYTIIPRKMTNVKNHLFDEINDNNSLLYAQRLLENEQSTLDTMAGQVQLVKQQRETNKLLAGDVKDGDNTTILDQMGLKIEVENEKRVLDEIRKLLGPNAHQAVKVYKVKNLKTQEKYNQKLEKAKNKHKTLYFHGSRNENWFNILQTGLLIRPSVAVHSGSMFGDGIYFADKAQKSIGYTSLKGSYWAHGSNNKAYLALFEVHLGNQMVITNHQSEHKQLSEQKIKDKGYDSVFAKGGYDLRNNEYIIYNPSQCTVSHLIEIKSN